MHWLIIQEKVSEIHYASRIEAVKNELSSFEVNEDFDKAIFDKLDGVHDISWLENHLSTFIKLAWWRVNEFIQDQWWDALLKERYFSKHGHYLPLAGIVISLNIFLDHNLKLWKGLDQAIIGFFCQLCKSAEITWNHSSSSFCIVKQSNISKMHSLIKPS